MIRFLFGWIDPAWAKLYLWMFATGIACGIILVLGLYMGCST